MDKLRVFIAVPISWAIQEELVSLQSSLQKFDSRANYTRLGNFHITLEFIGGVGEAALPKLKMAIAATAEQNQGFALKLLGWGSFSKKQEQVAWLGVGEGKAALAKLQASLWRNLQHQAWPVDLQQPYRPHLTMARRLRLPQKVKQLPLPEPKIVLPVQHMALMLSAQENNVLVYSELYTAKLG